MVGGKLWFRVVPLSVGLVWYRDVIVEESEELNAFPDIVGVNDELVFLRLLHAEDGGVVVVELVRVLKRDVEIFGGCDVRGHFEHILVQFPYVVAADVVREELAVFRLCWSSVSLPL